MSITDIRDAFIRAAGDKLHLDSLTMSYAPDGRAQFLRARGTRPDGSVFEATTEPFLGDTQVIMARAVQLADELRAPEARLHGTAVDLTSHNEGKDNARLEGADVKSKPVAAPAKSRAHKIRR